MTKIGQMYCGTMTWFARNDPALVAIVNGMRRKYGVRVASIGSGPIDWLLAMHPKVQAMQLVDASPAICGILERLQSGQYVSIEELNRVCRNQPDLPNTDLTDRKHIEMGLARLKHVGLLPHDWTIERILDQGIKMPSEIRGKIRILNTDACQLQPQFWKNGLGERNFDLVHFGGVIHQMERQMEHVGCMDDFYQGLRKGGSAVHIHTPLTHILRTEGDPAWPHLLDQLEANRIPPHFVVCVDAFISRDRFRGNYSVLCNSALKLSGSLDTWVCNMNGLFGLNLKVEQIAIEGPQGFQKVQPENGKSILLAMVRTKPNEWCRIVIDWGEMIRILETKQPLLTFGRNFHDGWRLYDPQAPL